MTLQLIECLKAGFDASFLHLLDEFSTWSHVGAGVAGLARTNCKIYKISDHDGLTIDQALAVLKRDHYLLYIVIKCHYLQRVKKQKDRQSILASALKKTGHADLAKYTHTITHDDFMHLLAKAERVLFELVANAFISSNTAISAQSIKAIQEKINALKYDY